MPGIFISYARADSQFALRLAQDLRASGAAVWIDQLDILPGQRWDSAVQTALNGAPTLLVVLSPASCASENVMDEVSFAISKGKQVVPVLYQQCDIPFRLARLQRIDAIDDYGQGLARLMDVLKGPEPAAQSASRVAVDRKTASATKDHIPTGVFVTRSNYVRRAAWILAAVGTVLVLGGGFFVFNLAEQPATEPNQAVHNSSNNRDKPASPAAVPKTADSPDLATRKQPERPKISAEGNQVAAAAKEYLSLDRSWRHDQTKYIYQFRVAPDGHLDFVRIAPPQEAGASPMRVKSIEHFDRGPTAWDKDTVIDIDWDPFSGQDVRSFHLTPDGRLLGCMQTEYFASRTETRKCQDSFTWTM